MRQGRTAAVTIMPTMRVYFFQTVYHKSARDDKKEALKKL